MRGKDCEAAVDYCEQATTKQIDSPEGEKIPTFLLNQMRNLVKVWILLYNML